MDDSRRTEGGGENTPSLDVEAIAHLEAMNSMEVINRVTVLVDQHDSIVRSLNKCYNLPSHERLPLC